MNNVTLDDEEKEILADIESGQYVSDLTPERKKEIEAMAKQSFKKDKRINIRLTSRDLTSLQLRAVSEGIPYQTLISSILHKYVSGNLKDMLAHPDEL